LSSQRLTLCSRQRVFNTANAKGSSLHPIHLPSSQPIFLQPVVTLPSISAPKFSCVFPRP